MKITTIDTRQGTENNYRFSNGNTLPLTGAPFAMNYFTIQTNGDQGSWFFDPHARRLEGFRLTHQPSPWIGDFQHLQILPLNLAPTEPVNELAGSYDPQRAIFSPNKLALHDVRYDIDSELIPATYGATLHSEYHHSENPGLQFELPGKFDLEISEHDISGWISNFGESEDPNFKLYVAIHFDQALIADQTRLFSEDCQPLVVNDPQHLVGHDQRLCVFFTETTSVLQIATSFISIEQAQLNLHRQLEKSIAQQAAEVTAQWQQYFDRIEINDRLHSDRVKTFYTTLYRLFLFPQKFYELDEQLQPIHYDTKVQTVKKGVLYTNNGFWDTYKTVYPFYSIIAPELLQDMLKGFLTSYQETGYLPKWLSPDERGMMPGTLIDAVIADAAAKNLIADSELPDFLEAMIKGATVQSADPKYGRRGTTDYLKYHFVPSSYDESVNHTLDYAYSDYCISVIAEKMNQPELASKYRQSALNYQHLFDPESGFIRPKDQQGQFENDFTPIEWGHGYTEGSVWQNGFAVYQDVAGLIKLYGGSEKFYQKLVELVNSRPDFKVGRYGFEIHEMSEMAALNFGQLALSNQPSFHIPYLFTYAQHPEMTQLLVKQLLLHAFNSGFTGFPGDEDNGSMAGWYVLSALGFYPVTPGSGEYVFGIPIFDEVILHLPDQKDFTLTTERNVDQNQFVQNRQLNSQNYHQSFLTHQQLMAGGKLQVTLGLAPDPVALTKQELPYSISPK
ncbi:GH92 family glycosyl hydrolase [Lapidilactobacillus mulanensis]|uniref:GH92 family glycosyl hydrolase n=1 Tax=Lapidilactobacillus mulanensis TaxID=2485999 RepID=A0ABW4DN47_9LACO|nr:GH92 family glycosyl hydrolase [Lapidilactobacillus mulanensis]